MQVETASRYSKHLYIEIYFPQLYVYTDSTENNGRGIANGQPRNEYPPLDHHAVTHRGIDERRRSRRADWNY